MGYLSAIRQWVHSHFGILFTESQGELFEGRIRSFCEEQRTTIEQLMARLMAGDRGTTLRLAEAVSTNYTFFFREAEIFDYFATVVLPTLEDSPSRIWSAAASSGDEAYSIAIACREVLGEQAPWRVRILGTDISERQLKQAEEGVYTAQQLSLVGKERLDRHFAFVGLGQFQVCQELRQMCTFRRMNLTQGPYPFEHGFDVIFLRNVLYYFGDALREAILAHCLAVAKPGAWLITSLTEPMLDVRSQWTRERPAIYRKVA